MSGTGEIDTPFLGLIKPPVGADNDVWGDRINTNSDTLDASASGHDARIAALESQIAGLQSAIAGVTTEAVGTVKWWPGGGPFPPGYLNCDGSALSTATYPALFAVLNYYWGGGGGVFYLPDLRGLVLVGLDQGTGRLQGQYGGDRLGGIGGVAIVTLAASQVPPHQHGGGTDAQGLHGHNVTSFIIGNGYYMDGGAALRGEPLTLTTDAQGTHQHNIITDVQGGGGAHTNVQPGAMGYWIIKAVT
jgi:microcystin-dependent protein